MSKHPLLSEIEKFIETHGMTESTFGRLAVKDWKFVRDLRGEKRSAPRRIWPETEQNVRDFMVTYRPSQDAAASKEAA